MQQRSARSSKWVMYKACADPAGLPSVCCTALSAQLITCNMCGCGKYMDAVFTVLAAAWWLAAGFITAAQVGELAPKLRHMQLHAVAAAARSNSIWLHVPG